MKNIEMIPVFQFVDPDPNKNVEYLGLNLNGRYGSFTLDVMGLEDSDRMLNQKFQGKKYKTEWLKTGDCKCFEGTLPRLIITVECNSWVELEGLNTICYDITDEMRVNCGKHKTW